MEHTVAYNPALTRTCHKQQCSELGWLCPDEHVDWWDRSHTCKYQRRKQSLPRMDLLSSYCFHDLLWIKVWDISLPNINSIDEGGIAHSTLPIYNINTVNPVKGLNPGVIPRVGWVWSSILPPEKIQVPSRFHTKPSHYIAVQSNCHISIHL